MKKLRPCPNMQQATWDDSVIELLPNTDLGRSMDELLGPDSDHSVEVLPQEHSETGATLDQSTPRRRHPSQQRGGRGARRVTFGDTASDRNSESEQSYDKHPEDSLHLGEDLLQEQEQDSLDLSCITG